MRNEAVTLRQFGTPPEANAAKIIALDGLVAAISLPSGPGLLPLAMSREDTAAWLGLGKTKTQALMSAGELQTAKIDGRTLVLTRSIIALVERNLVERDR